MDHPARLDTPPFVRTLGELLALSEATPTPLRAAWIERGSPRELWLQAGEVVHARLGALRGAPAVWAMLDDPTRGFPVESVRRTPTRSVHASWRQLCHEARCRLLDGGTTRVEETWLDISVDDLAER